jgi:hypothetical protein
VPADQIQGNIAMSVYKDYCDDCLEKLKKSNAVAAKCPEEKLEAPNDSKCGDERIITSGKKVRQKEGTCKNPVTTRVRGPGINGTKSSAKLLDRGPF